MDENNQNKNGKKGISKIIISKIIMFLSPILFPICLVAFLLVVALIFISFMFGGTGNGVSYIPGANVYINDWKGQGGNGGGGQYWDNGNVFMLAPSSAITTRAELDEAITSSFGTRIHPISKKESFHTGIDIGLGYGTRVVAARAGTVVRAGWQDESDPTAGYGLLVAIDHGALEDGENYITLYAHNSKLLVSVGDPVEAGELIALVGSTGYSTGNHIHFEVRKGASGEEGALDNSTCVDPYPYIRVESELTNLGGGGGPSTIEGALQLGDIRYREVDAAKLRTWLKDKKSTLGSYNDYVNQIISSAKEKNINPLLIIAIANQEQSLAPLDIGYYERAYGNTLDAKLAIMKTRLDNKTLILPFTLTSANAKKTDLPYFCANNPYNVGHTWWESTYTITLNNSTNGLGNTINTTINSHAIINEGSADSTTWKRTPLDWVAHGTAVSSTGTNAEGYTGNQEGAGYTTTRAGWVGENSTNWGNWERGVTNTFRLLQKEVGYKTNDN